MIHNQSIFNEVKDILSYYNYKDFFEILIFTIVIYYFSLWLKKDKHKNLLIPFYFFCICTLVSFHLNLPIFTYFICNNIPIILLLFLILHQETLQKNFIAYQNKLAHNDKSNDWISNLIGSCLLALNKNQDIVILVERNTNLEPFVKAPFKFYANLEKEIFQILLEKHIPNDNYMIWVNQSGKLVAINSIWNFELPKQLSNEGTEIWKQKGIFMSSKSDIIMIKLISINRKFDIIIQGKMVENLTTDKAFDIIKSNLINNSFEKKEVIKTKSSFEKNLNFVKEFDNII